MNSCAVVPLQYVILIAFDLLFDLSTMSFKHEVIDVMTRVQWKTELDAEPISEETLDGEFCLTHFDRKYSMSTGSSLSLRWLASTAGSRSNASISPITRSTY